MNMPLYESRPITAGERKAALETLVAQTAPSREYYLLVVGAIGLALGALFLNSVATLIGAMVVAPLAYPILGLGLGAAARDRQLFSRALTLLGVSLAAAVVLAFIGTHLFGALRIDALTITFTARPVLDFAVALIAGALAAYGLMRPKVGGAMTGVGIAVSLMPPLVATGVYVADGLLALAGDAFLIFAMNVLGIFIASALVFRFLRISGGEQK